MSVTSVTSKTAGRRISHRFMNGAPLVLFSLYRVIVVCVLVNVSSVSKTNKCTIVAKSFRMLVANETRIRISDKKQFVKMYTPHESLFELLVVILELVTVDTVVRCSSSKSIRLLFAAGTCSHSSPKRLQDDANRFLIGVTSGVEVVKSFLGV